MTLNILAIYEEQLHKNMNKKILVSETKSLTFQELENYSNYIAIEITKVCINQAIPFYLKDHFYVLPVVLGILKAGYIPMPLTNSLQLNKSVERVSDVPYDLLITDDTMGAKQVQNSEILILTDMEGICQKVYSYNTKPRKHDICYILCTSGTTGVPKKVFVREDNIVWILNTFYNLVNFTSNSRFLFSTPYTFDVSLTEIFAPIFTGGILICLEPDLLGFKKLNDIIFNTNISHLSISPSFAELLVEIDKRSVFANLKVLCIAGEQFPKSLAEKLRDYIRKGCRVFNLYGPTETSIYATYHELSDIEYDCVPIGVPLNGVKIKILSDAGEVASAGELCIGGNGLTSGYLLQPDIKKEKFKLIDNEEYYFTGDYVHYDNKFNLIFDGRKDQQIQLNGIRVELDEITSTVSKIAMIDSVRVVYHKKRIYVFYKSQYDLKSEIETNLPEYLNPIVIKVKEYIFSQNRKLDAEAMIKKNYNHNEDFNSKAREEIYEILSQYGVVNVSDLDSLDSLRFIFDLEKNFNVNISEGELYKLRTIDEILSFIKNIKDEKNKNDSVDLKPCSSTELSTINIKYKLNNYIYATYEDSLLSPNCTQERLFNNSQLSMVYFDLSLKKFDFKEVLQLDVLIRALGEKIDVLRMVAEQKEEKLNFKFLSKSGFQPCIFINKKFPIKEKLLEICKDCDTVPVSLIFISEDTLKARFYFIYHVVDLFSLNRVEKMVYQVYDNFENIQHIKSSSFYAFRKFIEKVNSLPKISELTNLVPNTSHELFLTCLDNTVWVAEFACSLKKVKDIILFSIYHVCKYILLVQGIPNITGAVSYNFREFKDFDSQDIIGDVHTKIPFELNKNDNYEDFESRFDSLLDIYSTGIDIRLISLKRNEEGMQNIMNEKWNKLNLSFNYIGETFDVNKTVLSIKEMKFESNFINLFTNKGKVYGIVSSDVFEAKNALKEDHNTMADLIKIIKY